MEPHIQYAKTSDGVNIAFWAMGSGPPLIQVNPPAGIFHAQFAWRIPSLRRWFERLTEGRTLITFVPRGTGLSDRKVRDHSLDAYVQDVEAVADHLGLGVLNILSLGPAPIAIAFTVRHPARVAHLVLWNGAARAADVVAVTAPDQAAAIAVLRDGDWRTFTEVYTHTVLGWEEGSEASAYAALMREGITREEYIEGVAALLRFDVSDILAELRVPTLVLARRGVSHWADVSKNLASQIKGARLRS